ncbi:WhiB family transcriptional regulator [Nocardia asiatica]
MTAILEALRTQEWRNDALCRAAGVDPEAWFPISEAPEAGAGARAMCRRCPVLASCGLTAAALGINYGIWAGYRTDFADEHEELRKRFDPNYRPRAPRPPEARGVCRQCGQEALLRNISSLTGHCLSCRKGYTPIAVVHARIQELVDAGWTLQEIADAAGLTRPTIRSIRHQKSGHVTPGNAKAILGVKPEQRVAL